MTEDKNLDRRHKAIVCPASVGELEEALARPSAADVEFPAGVGRRHPDSGRRGQDGAFAGAALPAGRRRGGHGAAHHRGFAPAGGRSGYRGDCLRPAGSRAGGAAAGVPELLYLAGRKFGSAESPELTWAMNTVVPANVAERFRDSRIVVFSTGNVYPLRAVGGGRIARIGHARRRSASTRRAAWDGSGSSSTSRTTTACAACSSASITRWICATACWWISRARCSRANRST